LPELLTTEPPGVTAIHVTLIRLVPAGGLDRNACTETTGVEVNTSGPGLNSITSGPGGVTGGADGTVTVTVQLAAVVP